MTRHVRAHTRASPALQLLPQAVAAARTRQLLCCTARTSSRKPSRADSTSAGLGATVRAVWRQHHVDDVLHLQYVHRCPPTLDSARSLHRQLTLPVAARPRAEGRAGEASTPAAKAVRSSRQCCQRLPASHMSTDGAAKHQAHRGPSAAAAGELLHAAGVRGRLRQRRAEVRSGPKYEARACTYYENLGTNCRVSAHRTHRRVWSFTLVTIGT